MYFSAFLLNYSSIGAINLLNDFLSKAYNKQSVSQIIDAYRGISFSNANSPK